VLYVLLWYSTAAISQDDNYVCTDFNLRCPCYLFACDSKSPKFILHDRLVCLKVAVTHIIDINEISKNKRPNVTKGHTSQKAILHKRPYLTKGHTYQKAILNKRPYLTKVTLHKRPYLTKGHTSQKTIPKKGHT
jgi:hypothetical protein